MTLLITPIEALQLAVSRAGTQEKFAIALGVSQPTVWRWMQSSKRIPAEFVLTVEREFGVSRHDLRPDIYPRDYPPAPEQTERWIGIDKGADRRVA